jgi:aspartyl/glutamyl-tRNA(Asn/Gln) amidotransferase C subunit
MEFNSETIDKLANLLMIGLTPEENKMVLDEFEIIDRNIDKINKIEGVSDAKPMCYALDSYITELREDVVEESPSIEELLQNCDQKDGREVEVPKVVE